MAILSKGDIEATLKSKLGKEDFEFVGCEDRSTADVSMGFLSSSGKVTLVYRSNGIIQELHVFVKRLPDQESLRNDVIFMGSFEKEPFVYNLFLNRMDESEASFFPRCFLARPNEIVILEDMASRGYKNLPMFQEYDMEHCKNVINSIAKLHAASFTFERKNNCRLDEYIPDLDKEHIFSTEENHVGRKRYLSGVTSLQKFTEVYLPKIPQSVVRRAFDFMKLVPHKLDHSETFPNVIAHSDLWNNNIMFKYDEFGGVSNACLIDYQCAAYRPPTFDLLLFIHCCTNRAFRSKHYTQLLEYYYHQLQSHLRDHDIDINSIMSWKTFEIMSKETLPIALVISVQFMHFACMPEEIIKPIITDEKRWNEYYTGNRNSEVLQAAEISGFYKEKVTEGLKDLFDNYVN